MPDPSDDRGSPHLTDEDSDLTSLSDHAFEAPAVAGRGRTHVASRKTIKTLEQLSLQDAQYQAALSEVPATAKLRLGAVNYIRMKAIAGAQKKRSWCWRHGKGFEIMRTDLGEVVNHKGKTVRLRGKKFWKCWHCKDHHPSGVSTTLLTRHLETVHGMSELGHQTPQPKGDPFSKASHIPGTPGTRVPSETSFLITKIYQEAFQLALLNWVIVCHIALSVVDNFLFRAFLRSISPIADTIVPHKDTLARWTLERFRARKMALKTALKNSKSGMIHFSFDLWTSPSHKALMGVVCHYVDDQNKSRSTLLAIRELTGAHTGENQAAIVKSVIQEYDLVDKIGYFVLDNAANNDEAVDIILYDLCDNWTPAERLSRRLRCLGHVLNLAAKAFLYGKDHEAFQLDHNAARDTTDLARELLLWRRRGPVGKLHNIIMFIRRSPQRIYAFRSICNNENWTATDWDDLDVLADNATRWNSLYKMVERALKLQARIDQFCFNNPNTTHGTRRKDNIARLTSEEAQTLVCHDFLTVDDWEQLREVMLVLKPFHDYTNRSQGKPEDAHRGSVSDYLITLNKLTEIMRIKKENYSSQVENSNASPAVKHLSQCLLNSWFVLDKYFARLDDSPIYYAAVITQPTMNWRWFQTKWVAHPAWRAQARKGLEILWEDYRCLTFNNGDVATPTALLNTNDWDTDNDMTGDTGVQEDDQLEKWMSGGPISLLTSSPDRKPLTPLAYWVSQLEIVPNLAQMAIDMLCVPAMSAECERVFSSAKLLISQRRNRLTADMIEACECLRAWIIADLKDEGLWTGKGWRANDL
jgi:hypothetical protein